MALGAIALGARAIGGLALGWHALGLMVAGRSGRGLLVERVVHHDDGGPTVELTRHVPPAAALIAWLGAAAIVYMLLPGLFSRIWPGEEQQRFIRKIARFWAPLACLPMALHSVGIELPLMADTFVFACMNVAFFWLLTSKLGPPRIFR
jgi:hypothetical protein